MRRALYRQLWPVRRVVSLGSSDLDTSHPAQVAILHRSEMDSGDIVVPTGGWGWEWWLTMSRRCSR
jgi:hypothetical protein